MTVDNRLHRGQVVITIIVLISTVSVGHVLTQTGLARHGTRCDMGMGIGGPKNITTKRTDDCKKSTDPDPPTPLNSDNPNKWWNPGSTSVNMFGTKIDQPTSNYVEPTFSGKNLKVHTRIDVSPNGGATDSRITYSGVEYTFNTKQYLYLKHTTASGKVRRRAVGSCQFGNAGNTYQLKIANLKNPNKPNRLEKVYWRTMDKDNGERVILRYDVDADTLEIWKATGNAFGEDRKAELGWVYEYRKVKDPPTTVKELDKIIKDMDCAVVVTRVNGEPVDPNHLSGERSGQYVSGDQRLTYTVQFENLKNATARARTVRATVFLDENLNASSTTFSATSHPRALATTSATDDRLLVTFRGIDLPPNIDPPEGQGWTRFSVRPESGLETGTEITAQASIVFNDNEPIETNEVTYVVDNTRPTSTLDVTKVATNDSAATYRIAVNSSDRGAGVAETTVYVARGNGSFQQLTDLGTNGTTIIEVEQGRRYRLASVAVDDVGNAERLTADTEVTYSPDSDPVSTSSGSVQNSSGTLPLSPKVILGGALAVVLVAFFWRVFRG